MKNKGWAWFVALCMTAALVAGVQCRCFSSDCSGISPRGNRAVMPQCHHEASSKQTAPDACCKKCQIEKAAVLSKESFVFQNARTQNGSVEKIFQGNASRTLDPTAHLRLETQGPPRTFFIDSIANVTFSFRAPPAMG